MARMCAICGKKVTFGNTISRRGRAKYLGGVGVKTTGISRRRFLPNLQQVRVELPGGTVKRVRVCAKCIRSGRVTKARPRPKLQADQAAS